MVDTSEYPLGTQLKNPDTGQLVELTPSGWKIVKQSPIAAAPLGIDRDAFRRGQDSLRAIEQAQKRTNWATTGFIGGLSKGLPGTPAYNLDRDIDPLRSRTVLQEMAQMRQGSAVGATGLGAMDKGEREMLAGAEGSLDLGQGERQIDANLGRQRAAVASRIKGLTADNPLTLPDRAQLNLVPVGAFYRDPVDGRVKRYGGQRKGAPGNAGGGRGAPDAAAGVRVLRKVRD